MDGSMVSDAVSYRLLGPLTAFRAERPLDLGPPKQRATLGVLLVDHGRVVSTDRLIDALWGEEPPPSALASLQAYVSNLRRVLREAAGTTSPIVRRGQGYVLDVPDERLDLADFTAAAQAARVAADEQRWDAAQAAVTRALGYWRGPLLEDFAEQPWVQAEAAAFEDLRAECEEIRITALLAAGRVAPALAHARALRATHPFRDRAFWLLLIALHRAGRSLDALAAYQDHVRRLDEELGLEPGPELRELQVAILRHEPALAAWPLPATWTGAPRLQTPKPGPESAGKSDAPSEVAGRVALVGREHERRVLDEALAELRIPSARWLVVTGPAGIGKTRLAEELASRARDAGGRDIWSRCSEEDGAPAWWPIRQLVRALGHDPDALLTPPKGVDADEARFVLYERVALLLADTARDSGPLVAVVDDVQWADRTSINCLAYLAGALREVPVAFALTLRDEELRASIEPLLAALARSDGHRQVAAGPLADAEVRQLAAAIAGAPFDDDELARRTGGNPLFVLEYARLPTEARLRGDAPLAVRTVLGRRLAGLAPEVLEVVRAAAVIGDVVDVPTIAAAMRIEPDVLADRLDEAADEHVIVPTPDTAGYAFAHGLLRDEVLAGLPAMRRRRLHARAAQALATDPDGDRVSRRAQHLVAALPLVDAAEVVAGCRAAARVAEQRWSSEAAAGWWAEALRAFDQQAERDDRERDELLVAQVEALARAGRGETVTEVVTAGLLDAERAGRATTVGRLAACLLRSAGAWPWTSYRRDPRPLVAQLDGLERFVADDPAAHVRLLAALAVGRCYDPDPAVPERLSRRALERAEAFGDPDVLADAILGRLVTFSGVAAHAAEAIELAERLIELPHREARVDASIAHSIASMAQFTRGDVAAAEALVGAAIAESDLLGLAVIRVQLRWMQGTLATWRGDFADAHHHHAIGDRVHGQTELYYSGASVMASHSLRRFEHGLAGASVDGLPEPLPWGAAIAAAQGDGATAERLLTTWLDALGPWAWLTLGHVTLCAEAVADAGLAGHAPRLLALLDPHAGEIAAIGHVGIVGSVDLARGRLLALLDERAAAREAIGRAREHALRTGGVPTVRRCEHALAALG